MLGASAALSGVSTEAPLTAKALCVSTHKVTRMLRCCCRRFCQMMWRLNFLVAVTCIVLENSYMLYYICPMHTIFTVFVYACLALGSKYNASNTGIWLKYAPTSSLSSACASSLLPRRLALRCRCPHIAWLALSEPP